MMRLSAIFSLLLLMNLTSPSAARLFWQTCGSVVTSECGATWNSNQDYFVPRYCNSCRYGLFSPCKTSCTTSPACRVEHALYPGYCSIYGPLHYCFRDHLYARKCGCDGSGYCGPYRRGCGPACHDGCRSAPNVACCPPSLSAVAPSNACPCEDYLPNVEPNEFCTLGSISLDGDPMLAALQLSQPAPPVPAPTPGGVSLPEQVLPLLGLPNSTNGPLVSPPN